MLLVTRILALIGATALLAMTTLTFVDVIGRYFLSRPVTAASEAISLLLGLTIFAALPAITQKNAHITVDLLLGVLSHKQNRIREILARLLTVFGLGLISYVLFRQAARLDSMYMATPHLRLPFAPFVYSMAGALAISTVLYTLASVRHFTKRAVMEGRA